MINEGHDTLKQRNQLFAKQTFLMNTPPVTDMFYKLGYMFREFIISNHVQITNHVQIMFKLQFNYNSSKG